MTIAFADPTVISWQIPLVRHYVPSAVHLIIDNSPDDQSSAEIRSIAHAESVPYLRTPANPWTRKAPSRSHGLALNWTWHNVIRPGEPEAFGFIDDDLFPTAPDDPFAPLAFQDVYGPVRQVGSRWFLWAGFCMFRYEKVRSKLLDFSQDWFIGLDTGGGNWRCLYRHLDLAALREPITTFFPFKSGVKMEDGPLQWCGTWLHEIGQMGRSDFIAEKRTTVRHMLAPYLKAATATASPTLQRGAPQR